MSDRNSICYNDILCYRRGVSQEQYSAVAASAAHSDGQHCHPALTPKALCNTHRNNDIKLNNVLLGIQYDTIVKTWHKPLTNQTCVPT